MIATEPLDLLQVIVIELTRLQVLRYELGHHVQRMPKHLDRVAGELGNSLVVPDGDVEPLQFFLAGFLDREVEMMQLFLVEDQRPFLLAQGVHPRVAVLSLLFRLGIILLILLLLLLVDNVDGDQDGGGSKLRGSKVQELLVAEGELAELGRDRQHFLVLVEIEDSQVPLNEGDGTDVIEVKGEEREDLRLKVDDLVLQHELLLERRQVLDHSQDVRLHRLAVLRRQDHGHGREMTYQTYTHIPVPLEAEVPIEDVGRHEQRVDLVALALVEMM